MTNKDFQKFDKKEKELLLECLFDMWEALYGKPTKAKDKKEWKAIASYDMDAVRETYRDTIRQLAWRMEMAKDFEKLKSILRTQEY
jgi:hypothetical protein